MPGPKCRGASDAQQLARRHLQIKFGNMVRRSLSFLLASVLLLAGLVLAVFEIGRPEGLRPFLLVGAGLMIGAAGSWLADEFLAYRQGRGRRT